LFAISPAYINPVSASEQQLARLEAGLEMNLRWREEFFACLGFFSRLPVGQTSGAAAFPRALRLAPFAGAALGLLSALPFVLALRLGEPPLVAAILSLAAAALLTGALHEDGLADVADGFGGGRTRERKLEIMRDSRIGAYGATALALSLGLRAACLAALAPTPGRALLILAAAGAVSRVACLAPLALLPSARLDGAGHAAGGFPPALFRPALIAAAALSLPPLLGGAALATCLGAALLAAVSTRLLCGLARTQIGGQTGDVAGAAQQAAEISFLLVFAGAAA
jgi:adenosylcobinamide-GDP ribazoletransferase